MHIHCIQRDDADPVPRPQVPQRASLDCHCLLTNTRKKNELTYAVSQWHPQTSSGTNVQTLPINAVEHHHFAPPSSAVLIITRRYHQLTNHITQIYGMSRCGVRKLTRQNYGRERQVQWDQGSKASSWHVDESPNTLGVWSFDIPIGPSPLHTSKQMVGL